MKKKVRQKGLFPYGIRIAGRRPCDRRSTASGFSGAVYHRSSDYTRQRLTKTEINAAVFPEANFNKVKRFREGIFEQSAML